MLVIKAEQDTNKLTDLLCDEYDVIYQNQFGGSGVRMTITRKTIQTRMNGRRWKRTGSDDNLEDDEPDDCDIQEEDEKDVPVLRWRMNLKSNTLLMRRLITR